MYNFKKAGMTYVQQLLACICWSSLESFISVNSTLEHFYDLVFAVIRDSVPQVRFNAAKYPPWYNPELISLVREKEAAHRQYIRNGYHKVSAEYEKIWKLRTEFKKLQKECHVASAM